MRDLIFSYVTKAELDAAMKAHIIAHHDRHSLGTEDVPDA